MPAFQCSSGLLFLLFCPWKFQFFFLFLSCFSFLFGLPLYHRTAPAPIGRILIGRRLTRRSDLLLRRRLRLLRSREACYTRAAAPIDRMYFKGVVYIMPFFKRNPTHRQVPFRRNLGRAFFLHPLLRIELIFGLFQIDLGPLF